MEMRGIRARLGALAIGVVACAALWAPSGAGAATVVNGNFESGSLEGWQVHRALEAGNWFAYQGSDEPIANKRQENPPQPPPQGKYAAVTDELNPDSLLLYQDVALAAGQSHRLSLLAYYDSLEPLAVPASGTLSADSEVLGGEANQQYRIDVMRPGAPLESVDPADVLATVFRTQAGGPTTMSPTRLSADLTPFAGQTVRLRFAVAAHEEVLMGGVDDVSISNAPPGSGKNPPAGRSAEWFKLGKIKLNRKNGSATLPVSAFGPGVFKAKDAGKGAKRIKPATVKVAKAGKATIPLRPTKAALAKLRQKHQLRTRVALSFKPTGEPAVPATVTVVLKLAPPRR